MGKKTKAERKRADELQVKLEAMTVMRDMYRKERDDLLALIRGCSDDVGGLAAADPERLGVRLTEALKSLSEVDQALEEACPMLGSSRQDLRAERIRALASERSAAIQAVQLDYSPLNIKFEDMGKQIVKDAEGIERIVYVTSLTGVPSVDQLISLVEKERNRAEEALNAVTDLNGLVTRLSRSLFRFCDHAADPCQRCEEAKSVLASVPEHLR